MNERFISVSLRVYQDLRYLLDRLPLVPRETPTERAILRHHIKGKVPLILDVGANLGSSVAFYRRLFPNARVIAFEPDPETFRRLSQRHGSASWRHSVELWRRCYARATDATAQYAQFHEQLPRSRRRLILGARHARISQS